MDNNCPLLVVLVMARVQKQFLISDHYRHDHYATRWGADFSQSAQGHYFPYDHFHAFPMFGSSAFVWVPRTETRGNWMYGSSNDTNTPAPALSQVDSLVQNLETLIKENKAEELASALRADFIFEHKNIVTKENLHTNVPSEVQGHIYTYQVCTVQPNIELLLLNHNATFRRLLALAKAADLQSATPKLYRTLVQQLTNLDLESADLSQLDLDEADLSHSKAKKANFSGSTFNNATCIGTDLQESNITKEQLESCKTYAHAKLPPGFWPYWTEDTKTTVLDGLKDLRAYGKKLQDQGIAKGEEAVKLADQLTADINRPAVKFNESFQRKFLQDLHSKDGLFDKHRSYKRIIANIALCVVSGIVGYLIAGAINKKLTGNFTFFAKTATHQLVEKVDQAFAKDRPALTPTPQL